MLCFASSEVPVLKMIALKLKIIHKLHRFYPLSTLKDAVQNIRGSWFPTMVLPLACNNMSFRKIKELYFFLLLLKVISIHQCKKTHKRRDLGLLVTWKFCVVSPWLVANSGSNSKIPQTILLLLNLHTFSNLRYGHLLIERLHLQPVFNGSTQPFSPLN